MNSSVFNDFLNSAKDVEERTASGKLFQIGVAAAAEKHLPPMVARQDREITRAVDDEASLVMGVLIGSWGKASKD